MATIQCRAIEQPKKNFTCEVIRPQSGMKYQDFSDGEWKPVQPEAKEVWNVLAETLYGATNIANYHFYSSKIISVTDNNPQGGGEL